MYLVRSKRTAQPFPSRSLLKKPSFLVSTGMTFPHFSDALPVNVPPFPAQSVFRPSPATGTPAVANHPSFTRKWRLNRSLIDAQIREVP